MDKAKIEAFKEILRYFVFFLISALITGLLTKLGDLPNQSEVTIFLTFVLRWLDKYFYEKSKEGKKVKSNLFTNLFSFNFER